MNRNTKDNKAKNFTISKVVGGDETCIMLSDTSQIEIRDPDEETADQEIDYINGKLGKTNTVRILKKRKTPLETLTIFILNIILFSVLK